MIKDEDILLGELLAYVISNDHISCNDLQNEFKLTEQAAIKGIELCDALGIITVEHYQYFNKDNVYFTITDISQLNERAMEYLKSAGYDAERVNKLFQGKPREEKEYLSNILNDSVRTWKNVDYTTPPVYSLIIIRITSSDKVLYESRSEIMYVEDLKIAKWDGNKYVLEGPFPKCDFSPLSEMEKLKEGSIVTHWTEATEKDIQSWKNRFNPKNRYKHLEVIVDDNMVDDVYKSLLLAAGCVYKLMIDLPKEDETRIQLEKTHSIMCDLQAAMDFGKISNLEEVTDNDKSKGDLE